MGRRIHAVFERALASNLLKSLPGDNLLLRTISPSWFTLWFMCLINTIYFGRADEKEFKKTEPSVAHAVAWLGREHGKALTWSR